MADVEERNRLLNIIFLLANALIASNFLGFSFAARNSGRLTLNVQIISWVIFIAALIAVNAWLYYAYYRKPQK
jgi:hypothetical protein